MAITTIRDLAFKISMKVNMENLKSANKAVDDFSAKVAKMQTNITNSMKTVNNRLNDISTFKAVSSINKITEATLNLKKASKMNNNFGLTQNFKPSVANQPQNKPKPKEEKKLFRPSVQMPYQFMLGRINVALTVAGGLTMAGIYGWLGKINNIQLQMTKNTTKRNKLLSKQLSYQKSIGQATKKIEGLIGTNNLKMMGGIKGLSKMLSLALALGTAIKAWRKSVQIFGDSIRAYSDNINGLVRQEAFFANALKYREQVMKEGIVTGAKTYRDFKEASRNSLMEARRNIKAVSQEGIVGAKELNVMVGQLASFQIDTKAWFGGNKGERNIRALSDLMGSIQAQTGSKSEALRVANMIGKAVTMGQFGQMQRWGIVLSDTQKQIIRTGTTAEKLSTIMEGLEQNVGNFNKQMMETPMGKYINLQNKMNDQLVALGGHTIMLKIEFLKLKLAMMPLISAFIRVGSALSGLVILGFNKITDGIRLMFTPSDQLTERMKTLKWVLIGVAGVFATLNAGILTTIAPFVLAGIAIEDFWSFLKGGDSIIGRLISQVKLLAKTFSEAFSNNIIVKSIRQASQVLGVMRKQDELYQTDNRFMPTKKTPQPIKTEIGRGIVSQYQRESGLNEGMQKSIFVQDGAFNINIQSEGDPEATSRAVRDILSEEMNKVLSIEGVER